MLDTLWESHETKPRGNDKQPAQPPKAGKVARATRLQLEQLESREVLSVSVPAIDGDAQVGDVMQASQISAFYQQSALVSAGRPTTDPTVSWGAPKQERQSDALQAATQRAVRLASAGGAEIEVLPAAITRLQLTPGQAAAARWSGGLPRLSQDDALWPQRVFVPNVDLGVWPTFDLLQAAETQNLRYFNLAFVTADSQNRPSWAGHEQYAIDGSAFDMALRGQIAELRALGGDVSVCFGGSQGTELALVIDNAEELKRAYRDVVDAYQLKRIDFAVEGASLADAASIERRSRAIAELQQDLAASGRKLDVWLTLPATRAGLTPEGLKVVNSALRHGVELGGVNIKPERSGEQPDGTPHASQGVHTIEAAISVFYQLQKSLGPSESSAQIWNKIGVTPAIGAGDAGEPRFEQTDAREVLDFAEQQGLGMIGMWSLNRDQPGIAEPVNGGAPAGAVEQAAHTFSEIFLPFTKTPAQ